MGGAGFGGRALLSPDCFRLAGSLADFVVDFGGGPPLVGAKRLLDSSLAGSKRLPDSTLFSSKGLTRLSGLLPRSARLSGSSDQTRPMLPPPSAHNCYEQMTIFGRLNLSRESNKEASQIIAVIVADVQKKR
jgi:hypothetical protein